MKLPLSIKQLLTLRKPNANQSPPAEALYGAFACTLKEAARHHAQDGWLVLTTSTLLSANVPRAVGHLYRYASRDPALQDRAACASLMREAALKSAIFVGVPRTILSLEALTASLEDDVRAALRNVEATTSNIDEFQRRGRQLWKDIYAPHDVKLANKLAAYHPDFMSFITQSYGTVLSPWTPPDRAYTPGNVRRTLTSVVGVACLRAEGGVGPQLVSHVYGLLKAVARGDGDGPREYAGDPATEGDRWLSSDEGAEWVIRTADEICDALRASDEEEVKEW